MTVISNSLLCRIVHINFWHSEPDFEVNQNPPCTFFQLLLQNGSLLACKQYSLRLLCSVAYSSGKFIDTCCSKTLPAPQTALLKPFFINHTTWMGDEDLLGETWMHNTKNGSLVQWLSDSLVEWFSDSLVQWISIYISIFLIIWPSREMLEHNPFIKQLYPPCTCIIGLIRNFANQNMRLCHTMSSHIIVKIIHPVHTEI